MFILGSEFLRVFDKKIDAILFFLQKVSLMSMITELCKKYPVMRLGIST